MAKEKKNWKFNLIELNSIKYDLNNPTPEKNIRALSQTCYLLINKEITPKFDGVNNKDFLNQNWFS